MPNNLLTPELLEQKVEQLVYDSDDQITHLEALLEICEKLDLEPEAAALILTANLKSKIEVCAMNLKMIEQRSTLPFEW